MANQKTWAFVIGAILILIGIIGFFNNPVIGIFSVNVAQNLVHILSGLILVMAGATNMPQPANKTFGVIYLIMAIIGFIGLMTFLNVASGNDMDNWLHLVLGIVLAGVGWSKS